MGAATDGKQRATTAAVVATTAASAVAAAFAGGEPTGIDAADVVWSVLFAAGVTWCAAFAGRWSWIVAAGVAAPAAVGGTTPVVVGGLLALALALVGGFRRERSALIGAVAVALVAQVLLRLPTFGFSGASALVAAAAVMPVIYSAWRRSTRRVRRRSLWGVAIAGAVVALALVPAAVSAVVTARESNVATRESRAWLDAAREGDQPAAIAHLDASQRAFSTVEDATGAPWLWPARVLPVVGTQISSVNQVAGSGDRITSAAVDAARIATPENLQLRNGRIDLDLVRALQDPLRRTSIALQDSQSDLADLNRTWLLPFLQTKVDEYADQVDDAAGDTDLAVQALDVVPGLLGGDGPRTYLVLFASPAETRELGGFVGNAAIVTTEAGQVTLENVVRSRELNEATANLSAARLDEISVQGFPTRYLEYEPWRNWQNVTGTPDFPTVSNMARELAPEAIGRPVDGVLYVDPEGLAGLLQLTGPIDVEGLDEQISSDNVVDFLLREQYVLYPETPDRADFLEGVAERTFELLTTSDLPGPRTIGDALGGPVDGGHIRMWTFDPAEQALFSRLGTSGAFGRSDADDDLMVTVANANPNKIDAYLHRDVAYEGELDPASGEVTARVTVTLENTAPTDLSNYVIGNANGEPRGTNRTFLSLYSGLGVVGAVVDGAPVVYEAQAEYGLRRAGVFVSVPPSGRTQIVFELRGVTEAVDDRGAYLLRVHEPALVFSDRMTARLAVDGGAGAVGVPDLFGALVPSPAPELASGSATFEFWGEALVRFPLGG